MPGSKPGFGWTFCLSTVHRRSYSEMPRRVCSIFRQLMALTLPAAALCGAELKPYSGSGCAAVDDYFAGEVWAKVGALSCVKCHQSGGDAEDSKFVLRDLTKTEAAAVP